MRGKGKCVIPGHKVLPGRTAGEHDSSRVSRRHTIADEAAHELLRSRRMHYVEVMIVEEKHVQPTSELLELPASF